jgi:hypothetical protein
VDATPADVLLVDDLADSADSLAEVLIFWGYDAEPLYSGAAALSTPPAPGDRTPSCRTSGCPG